MSDPAQHDAGAGWQECLDRFARSLDAQRAALTGDPAAGDGHLADPAPGDPAPGDPAAGDPAAGDGHFAPPPGLGPLPEQLVPRALDLLDQAREVERQLTAAVAGASQQLRLVHRLAGHGDGRTSAYLDSRS